MDQIPGNFQEYGPPSFRGGLSQEYGTPNLRSGIESGSKLSEEYAPSFHLSQKYDPLSSLGQIFSAVNSKTGTSQRSSSREYSAPSSRTAIPSPQYGASRNLDEYSDQSYESYARNYLELLNQEPANYEFSYKVSDYESGSDFGHAENRQDDKGDTLSYFLLEPNSYVEIIFISCTDLESE
ncbi:unnamed protein product [Parnassius apollo]|uniref:(apollo) hypothetical protein n=1 Tax=Parnassius apollo TaxID=110799 RepID=A0A8S3WH18_PARAO|nr:unnamed protein product [Parnassius apollo]